MKFSSLLGSLAAGVLAAAAYAQPAVFTDLGDLSGPSGASLDQSVLLTSASEVRWFKMVLPAVTASAGYVDMWASQLNDAAAITASDLTDTDLALYNGTTNALVTYNDATGPGLFGQLSYGSTTSRGTTTASGQTAGAARNGTNGVLSAGIYYLAVAQYNLSHPATGYALTSNYAGAARNTTVHIRVLSATAPSGPAVSGGASTPATALSGTTRLLTVTVVPGANHTNTAISTVLANLSSIGGSSSAPFHNDGINGDVSGADNIWSYEQVATAAPGTYPLTVTATDGDAYTGSTGISVTVFSAPAVFTDVGDFSTGIHYATFTTAEAATPTWFKVILPAMPAAGLAYADFYCVTTNFPSGTLPVGDSTDPDLALYDNAGTKLTTDDGDGPGFWAQISRGSTVVNRGNTPVFGGQTGQLAKNGYDGPLVAGTYWIAQGHFSMGGSANGFAATCGAAGGNTVLVIETSDGSSPIPPAVSGGACTPAVAASGASRTLTCTVTPATNGPSPTATVTANLSAFTGGSATEPMFDDGAHGDGGSGDGVYGYVGALSGAAGGYSVIVTATSADARVGTGTIAVALSNPVLSLGDLSAASSHSETVYSAAYDAEVRFFSFTAPAVSAAAGWVDIWTLPSGLGDAMTDTELGLYDSAGNLVGLTSDDEGQGLFSLLTYGDTVSRGFAGTDGPGLRNGANGTLSNAVYYIAVGRYAVTFGATGFNATSAPTAAGQRSFKLVIDIGVTTDPTGPSVTSGAAAPANGLSGASRTLTVTVTPGANHAGTAITGVSSDLSSIGGPISAAFLNDGVAPDAAIDNIYTWAGTLSGAAGPHSVTVTATDADAYTGSTNISVSFYILPTATDIGKIAGSDNNPATADVYTGTFTQVAGGVNWVKFNIITAVQDDASAVTEGTWLDIDTEGTGIDGSAFGSLEDTYIGMYRSDSTLIGSDDDSGTYFRSQLTFGDTAPTRPGIVSADTLDTGFAGDGFNGNLAVGTYYVAFANYPATMLTGFNATSTGTAAGTYVINFRTNLPVSPSATPPSVSGVTVARSTPGLLTSGSTVLVTATVAVGTSPSVGIATVTANLTNIGGGAAVAMLDDGVAPDAAIDGVYTCSAVATGSVGPHSVTVTATDTIARSGNANGTCTIVAPPQCSIADIGVQGGTPGQDRLLDNNDFVVFISFFFNANPIADMGVQGGTPGSDTLFDNNDFVVFIGYFFTDQPNCTGNP